MRVHDHSTSESDAAVFDTGVTTGVQALLCLVNIAISRLPHMAAHGRIGNAASSVRCQRPAHYHRTCGQAI